MEEQGAECIRELIKSKDIVDAINALGVTTEVVKDGRAVIKGGSIVLEKEDISGYEGTVEDAVNQINNIFKEEKKPYFASLVENGEGNVRIRVYRISEKFEIERYGDKKIPKEELDEIKKRFDEGHKINNKDDFYEDLFSWNENIQSKVSLSSDEIIYVLSLDKNYFDISITDDKNRSLKIHVDEKVGLNEIILLMKKFRPEDIELENGWIVMWFD